MDFEERIFHTEMEVYLNIAGAIKGEVKQPLVGENTHRTFKMVLAYWNPQRSGWG